MVRLALAAALLASPAAADVRLDQPWPDYRQDPIAVTNAGAAMVDVDVRCAWYMHETQVDTGLVLVRDLPPGVTAKRQPRPSPSAIFTARRCRVLDVRQSR